MDSAKIRVLKAIAESEPVANPHSLQARTDMSTHNVVHIIYSLQKAGLLKFHTTKNPPQWKRKTAASSVSMRVPTKIRLTKEGWKLLDRTQR